MAPQSHDTACADTLPEFAHELAFGKVAPRSGPDGTHPIIAMAGRDGSMTLVGSCGGPDLMPAISLLEHGKVLHAGGGVQITTKLATTYSIFAATTDESVDVRDQTDQPIASIRFPPASASPCGLRSDQVVWLACGAIYVIELDVRLPSATTVYGFDGSVNNGQGGETLGFYLLGTDPTSGDKLRATIGFRVPTKPEIEIRLNKAITPAGEIDINQHWTVSTRSTLR